MADKILSIADGLHDELPSTTTAIAGRILITTDRGEMYYEPEDKKRIQVNPQADWQQNDETANDYVKNRPGGYDTLTDILPETTLNFTSRGLTLTNCPPIEVGKKYIVTFYNPETETSENNEYELIGQSTSSGIIYIGNETCTWGGIDTGEPFIIYTTSSNTTSIWISSSTTLPYTYNIKIKAFTSIKINEKYLDIKNTNIVDGSAKGSLRTIGSTKEDSGYKIGSYAFAEGYNTSASGGSSHAEGGGTRASGTSSHAEGEFSTASGLSSHAEGRSTTASGTSSHAEGEYATASGLRSHAEGWSTTALSYASHAEGYSTITGQMGFRVTACKKLTDTTGTYTLRSITGLSTNQRYSVCLKTSKANCGKITAIDSANKKITVDGYPDIALSTSTSSTANYLTIVGSPKLGDILISGHYSHAEGYGTTASGDSSHAEGEYATASGINSHAEGGSTTASGGSSHAEGGGTRASGTSSHAEGEFSTASGLSSHAEGYGTQASSDYQHVQGKYNIADATTYADIIGNGSSDTERSNAATVDWNGNAWYAGDVYVGSTSGTNKDEGSKKLATEEYVDTQIGDINTTLDSIIEMQNSLIGGN